MKIPSFGGFLFRARGLCLDRQAAAVDPANGSDGSLLDMWLWGGAGAVARGYDCLTFDGPGRAMHCGNRSFIFGRIGRR